MVLSPGLGSMQLQSMPSIKPPDYLCNSQFFGLRGLSAGIGSEPLRTLRREMTSMIILTLPHRLPFVPSRLQIVSNTTEIAYVRHMAHLNGGPDNDGL